MADLYQTIGPLGKQIPPEQGSRLAAPESFCYHPTQAFIDPRPSMKSIALLILAFLTLGHLAVAPAAIKSTDTPEEDNRAANPTVLQDYRQVLAQIPADLRDTKPREWTSIQRDKANAAFEQAFLQLKTSGKFLLKVKNIADWNGWTLHAEVPNEEGYMIRVFCKFSPDWKDKLAAVNRGDTVTVEGIVSSISYRDVWRQFTLSINLKDCTFTK
jgi:hypothetical protein